MGIRELVHRFWPVGLLIIVLLGGAAATRIDYNTQVKNGPVINVEAFGAKAGSDSTAAFQAALNSIPDGGVFKLTIPNNGIGNCYLISSTLTFTGGSGFTGGLTIQGGAPAEGGDYGSCIKWTGAANSTMIHLMNPQDVRIQNISFDTRSASGVVAVWLDALETGSTQGKDFKLDSNQFGIGASGTGLVLGRTGCSLGDVADGSISNSQFIGDNSGTNIGVDYQCGGNSRDISFYDTTFESLGYGYKGVGAAVGWTDFYGCFWASNLTTDISQNQGQVNIFGGGSEGSVLMIKAGSGSTTPMQVHIDGYYFDSESVSASAPFSGFCGAIGDAIMCLNSVNLIIQNSLFANQRIIGTTIPNIVDAGLDSSSTGLTIISRGNQYINTTGVAPLYMESTILLGPVGTGYITSNGLYQMAVESFGDLGVVSGVSSVALTPYSPSYPAFYTPASSSAACRSPKTAYDASYVYVCTTTNTWKRAALSSF